MTTITTSFGEVTLSSLEADVKAASKRYHPTYNFAFTIDTVRGLINKIKELEIENKELKEPVSDHIISVKRTDTGYTETICSFKSSTQAPSLMVYELYYVNDRPEFGKVIFEID